MWNYRDFPIFPWKLVHFISIFGAFNHVGHCWFLAYWKINVLFSRLCCQKVLDYLKTVRSTVFHPYQTITNIWPQVFNQELVYLMKLKCIIVGFFIPVSSLKVFGHSIHSERMRVYLGKSFQNDTIIISWVFSFRVIQPTVPWRTFKTFVCFHQFLFIIKTFRDSRLFKYLINKELIMTFSNKIQAKTFTWPDMLFYAR